MRNLFWAAVTLPAFLATSLMASSTSSDEFDTFPSNSSDVTSSALAIAPLLMLFAQSAVKVRAWMVGDRNGCFEGRGG